MERVWGRNELGVNTEEAGLGSEEERVNSES